MGDCYAYDDKPDIGMQLSTQMRADGRQALELWARSHIACTGPDALKVTSDDHYLLSFTYQDPGGKYAGYYISFNDPAETVVTERLQHGSQNWQTFSKEISVPPGATSLRLLLYAFPDPYSSKRQIVHYDEVSLLRIPPAQNRFYRINEQTGLQQPAGMTFRATSPTRTVVQIEGARKPFYLTTHESYHPMWQAEVLGTRPKIQLPFTARHAVRPAEHVRLNGTMNGWYIDPAKLCAQTTDCVRHADGSYDFTLALEFVPQRWFYFGGTLSALTLLAGIMYYLYDRRQGERHIEGRWQWHR